MIGWASSGGPPDAAVLREAAAGAACRGPDGWGASWTADGRRLQDAFGDGDFPGEFPAGLAESVGAVVHFRLATSGPLSFRGPAAAGGGRLAHNGTVANAAALKKVHRLVTRSDVDTEVIALLAARHPKGVATGLREAAAKIDPPTPQAFVGLWPGRLVALAAGQPLHVLTRPEGSYLGSGVLEGSAPAPRGEAVEFTLRECRRRRQPLHDLTWVPRESIRPNEYNPNAVPPPELRLLRLSILEDGWTQPVVVHRETMVIIDGEHRWTVAGGEDIAALTGGLVPVVFVEGDVAKRMMSTVRHNRARGEHGVLPMGEIVRALLEGGQAREDVMFLLQMEAEEVERLAERAGMPDVVSRKAKDFNEGWIPG